MSARIYERMYLYAGGQGLNGGSAGDKDRPAATSTGTAPSRMSVPGGPLLLFGVSRDLSRADDVNEPRYRDEIDHRSNDHRKQPGGCYLPPSTHHSPLSVARGSEPVGPLVGEKQGAHRALVTMPQANSLATKS